MPRDESVDGFWNHADIYQQRQASARNSSRRSSYNSSSNTSYDYNTSYTSNNSSYNKTSARNGRYNSDVQSLYDVAPVSDYYDEPQSKKENDYIEIETNEDNSESLFDSRTSYNSSLNNTGLVRNDYSKRHVRPNKRQKKANVIPMPVDREPRIQQPSYDNSIYAKNEYENEYDARYNNNKYNSEYNDSYNNKYNDKYDNKYDNKYNDKYDNEYDNKYDDKYDDYDNKYNDKYDNYDNKYDNKYENTYEDEHNSYDKTSSPTLKDWIVILLLTAIPVVNIVLLIKWALDKKNPQRQTFAKAFLFSSLVLITFSLVMLNLFYDRFQPLDKIKSLKYVFSNMFSNIRKLF